MTTDDLDQVPHVVIVESASGIRITEFEIESHESPMIAAHKYAEFLANGDLHGRIIVCARVRTMQPFDYIKQTKHITKQGYKN